MDLGSQMIVDPDLLVPDAKLTIEEGAFEAWAGSTSNYYPQFLAAVCEHYAIPRNVPVSEISSDQMKVILYGTGGEKIRFRYENDMGASKEALVPFEGIIRNLERRFKDTFSEGIREHIQTYMSTKPCPKCKGQRLKPETLAVTINGKNIAHATSLSIGDAEEWFKGLDLERAGADDCQFDSQRNQSSPRVPG